MKNQLLLLGDFNFPGINWETETTKHQHNSFNFEDLFLNTIHKNFLYQMVTEPTHSRNLQTPTLIDLVITNNPSIIGDINYNAPIGNSHHAVLSFQLFFDVLGTPVNKPDNNNPIRYMYDKGDYAGMKKYFKDIDWSLHFKADGDVKSWNDCLEAKIAEGQDIFIPKINNRTNKPKRNFSAPQTLLSLLQDKRKAFKYYKKYPTENNLNTYHYFRNQVNIEVKKAKVLKEINISKFTKTNPKVFYKYVNSQIKHIEKVANLLKENNEYTENDQEKADTLNNFFSSVFVEEGDGPVPTFSFDFENELNDIIITEQDIYKTLSKLNTSKAPGPDCIHPRILKELASELAFPFHALFQKTLKEGKLPDKWKEAQVKPIFKKGRKDLPGNYRPVSLTSISCKVFETIVRDALYQHLLDNSILSKDQYGFCKQRSTVSQLLVTLDEWLYHLDNRTPVDAAYLDFKKAFDSVPHKRLLSKLHGYGIRGNTLEWIRSFLSGRSQYVNVNNYKSDKVPVTSGVPQGSVLGPCLFVYFINDLPEVVKCLIKIFADDTKAYLPIFSIKDCENLQDSINKLVDWTKKWLISFNSEKCKILHLGTNNPGFHYTIEGNNIISQLEVTDCEKDIGVFVDSNLTFDKHIITTVNKARKLCGLLCRTISHKIPVIMVPLYKALVRMILEFANVVWSPYKKKYITMIEKVQRHFTKTIFGMKNLTYEQRLTKLKLPSLEYRRLRGDLIEAYKILNNIYDPLTTKKLLTVVTNNRTRNNSLKLFKHRVNFKPYQHFFTNRIVSRWNRLPSNIVSASSLNCFKNRLDKHFKGIMYKINLE